MSISKKEIQEIIKELDLNYRSLFDQYAGLGGVPLALLAAEVRRQGMAAGRVVPEISTVLLLKAADRDHNRHISFTEFTHMLTSPTHALAHEARLTVLQSARRWAVASVTPNRAPLPDNTYVVDSYVTNYSCCPPPVFTVTISVIQLCVFIYYAARDDPSYTVTATSGFPYASPLVYNPARRQEVWRLITYMLVHSGYIHLIVNLVLQLVLGIPLEMVHSWRVPLLYLLGVIGGGVGHSVIEPYTMLAGASAGAYTLLGAHLATVIMNWREMTHDWTGGVAKILTSAPVKLTLWGVLAIVDTGVAIYDRFSDDDLGIGFVSHFAGTLTGVLVGVPLLRNIHSLPWEQVVFWICLVVFHVCVCFAVFWNIFYPGYPQTDSRPCCPYPVIQ